MNVYQDLKKIIYQILGKRNMFEYQTTLANQANLLYNLLGKIYTTDKLHRHTTSLFIITFVSTIIVGTAEFLLFLLFYIHEDLLTQMYALFVIFVAAFTTTIVIMNYAHRHSIESTIQMIDKLVARRLINSCVSDEQINMKVLLFVAVSFFAMSLPFFLGCVVDVAIFYDENKVKNNIYYIVPVPNIEQYGSLSLYVVINVVTVIIGSTAPLVILIILILPLMWGVVCHNEIQHIVHELSSLSENLNVAEQFPAGFECKFKNTIIQCVHAYRDVIKTVEYFRGFYETMASILLPFMLLFGVIHAHILTTSTYPYIVMLKEFCVFLIALLVLYVYCWVGEILTEMTDTMSFAVYSTPWYMSTKVRKDVYIFLCQTQNSINPTAWRVYPVSLATFLRFMNVVQSSVNILRAVATK